MIIECRNGKIEICDTTYKSFLESIRREEEKDFIKSMEHVDNNESVDYIIKTDWKIDYVSVDDICFALNNELKEVRHAGFGKFIITLYKAESPQERKEE